LTPPNPLPEHLLTPSPLPIAGLRFRQATADDYAALHRLCYPQYTARDFARQFERSLKRQATGRGYHLVALLDTAAGETVPPPAPLLVGSGQLILHPHSTEVAELSVPPAYRGRGIGTVLIGVLTKIARHLGMTSLEIAVMPDNVRALALYERLGFVVDRHLRVAFAANAALILVKDLNQLK
jgi:ribosomal protein S18 acetylase RimI-like enzyme